MASAQLEVAIKAAIKAGKIINRESMNIANVEVHEKAQFDFVSNVDTACEAAIIETLNQYFPSYGIIAEEGGRSGSIKSDYVWVIDPLDGTTNFLHGFPQYAVSIALTYKGRCVVAVVYDPTRNELFTAERGKGAFLNNKRIRVSGRTDFSQSLIETGLPLSDAPMTMPASCPNLNVSPRVLPGFVEQALQPSTCATWPVDVLMHFGNPIFSVGTLPPAH